MLYPKTLKTEDVQASEEQKFKERTIWKHTLTAADRKVYVYNNPTALQYCLQWHHSNCLYLKVLCKRNYPKLSK